MVTGVLNKLAPFQGLCLSVFLEYGGIKASKDLMNLTFLRKVLKGIVLLHSLAADIFDKFLSQTAGGSLSGVKIASDFHLLFT
jgi:hypothetical protein